MALATFSQIVEIDRYVCPLVPLVLRYVRNQFHCFARVRNLIINLRSAERQLSIKRIFGSVPR